jgi:hypothetical protein
MATVLGLMSVEVAGADSAGIGTTVGGALYVRAVNTHATTAYTVSVAEGAIAYPFTGTILGTSSIPGAEELILKKTTDQIVYTSNAAVKLTKVTPPRG